MLTILVVLLIVTMFLWGLAKAGAVQVNTDWMAFIAVLILALIVVLFGYGVLVPQRVPL